MTPKVNKTPDFVFMQLIEHEPGIYDKCHPDYAGQDKIDLGCERISHEMKESGMHIYFLIETNNRIEIQNSSAKAVQSK
jgi:hypothetical protein